MFNTVSRIMNVDGIVWHETIPDTCYRNHKGWLIVRAKGAHNKGTIKGSRFYVITRDANMKPKKMRSAKGQVLYFVTPLNAASHALAYSLKQQEEWDATLLLNKWDKLRYDIKQEEARLAELQAKVAELKQTIASSEGSATKSDGQSDEEALSQLPSFMHKAVTVVRQRYH